MVDIEAIGKHLKDYALFHMGIRLSSPVKKF